MKIALLKTELGTPKHLIHDGERFTWSSSIPEQAWVYPRKKGHRSFESVLDALSIEIDGFKKTPHAIAWNSILQGNSKNIPWMYALPGSMFQSIAQRILDQLWMVFKSESDSYYMNEFVINRDVLEGLSPPVVSEKKVADFLKDATEKSKSDLLKFLPDPTGRATPSVYTQNNTVTGRVTVTSGPNILTLKKKYRDIMVSEYKGGQILQVDIVSLEPRVALCVAGKQSPDDIYSDIRENVLDSSLTRSQAKISTLGCIYGMSPWTLSKKLPDTLNAREIMMKVRDYFDIPYLERNLKKEFNQNGFIKNTYGRKIFSGDALVNHYLQSSGADASLQCFSSLIDLLKDEKVKFKTLYVIHDAILIDTNPEGIMYLKKISQRGLHVPGFDQKFPITVENTIGEKIE